MKVVVNDTEITFPSSLADITLGQRIDYHNTYGKELEEKYDAIKALDDELVKELDLLMWQMDSACKTFSFFSGIDLSVVQESEVLDKIMKVDSVLKGLLNDTTERIFQDRFEWKGETWVLHTPELSTTATMKFGEFVDSKQIIQDLTDFGASTWEALIRLCAIYLRKDGEDYHKSFAEEDGDRFNLMKELPMDIALAVGFFLNSSTSLYLKHLQYSESQPLRAEKM